MGRDTPWSRCRYMLHMAYSYDHICESQGLACHLDKGIKEDTPAWAPETMCKACIQSLLKPLNVNEGLAY